MFVGEAVTAVFQPSLRDLFHAAVAHPTLKRWAIFNYPSGIRHGDMPRHLRVATLSRLQLADDEWGELFVEVWGDSRFEAGRFSAVVAFDNLADFVQARDDFGFVVWHGKFHEFANGTKLTAQFGQQIWNAFAASCRDCDGVRMAFGKTGEPIAVTVQLIDFVENHQSWFAVRADFFEDGVDGLNLIFGLGMAGIDNVQEQIGFDDFLKSRFERFD